MRGTRAVAARGEAARAVAARREAARAAERAVVAKARTSLLRQLGAQEVDHPRELRTALQQARALLLRRVELELRESFGGRPLHQLGAAAVLQRCGRWQAAGK